MDAFAHRFWYTLTVDNIPNIHLMYAECFSTYCSVPLQKVGLRPGFAWNQSSLHLSQTQILLHCDSALNYIELLEVHSGPLLRSKISLKKHPFQAKSAEFSVGFPWLLIHKGLHRFRAWTPTNLAGKFEVSLRFNFYSNIFPKFIQVPTGLFVSYLFLGIVSS